MYIINPTFFDLFCRPSSRNTLKQHKYICGIHACVSCTVLPDDCLQKRPKHVAVVIYIMKIRLCLVGKKRVSVFTSNLYTSYNQSPVARLGAEFASIFLAVQMCLPMGISTRPDSSLCRRSYVCQDTFFKIETKNNNCAAKQHSIYLTTTMTNSFNNSLNLSPCLLFLTQMLTLDTTLHFQTCHTNTQHLVYSSYTKH
jgi:hypothetical protein